MRETLGIIWARLKRARIAHAYAAAFRERLFVNRRRRGTSSPRRARLSPRLASSSIAHTAQEESFASDSDRLARFQREAEVLASFKHPDIGRDMDSKSQTGVVRSLYPAHDGSDGRLPRTKPSEALAHSTGPHPQRGHARTRAQ